MKWVHRFSCWLFVCVLVSKASSNPLWLPPLQKKKRSYSWLSNNSIAASWACSVKVESTFTASASLLFWLCWLDPPVLSGSAHQTCNCVSLPLCLSFSQWFMCLSVYVPELFFMFKFSSTTPVTPVLTLPHVSDVDLIRAGQQVKLWQ